MTVALMPDVSRPVLLIDLSAIYRSAWHVSQNEPTSVAFEATLGGVQRAIGKVQNPLVAICCDSRSNWRKKLSPAYKAHREKQPESMYGLLDKVKARLVADGHLLYECDGFEADDVIATACKAATDAGHLVTIATHDKDALQLVNESVNVLSTRTWEFMDEPGVIAKFGVPPTRFGDWLALVGDSSDGIAGVPGVGPKRATDLIAKHGSLAGLHDAVKDYKVGDFTPAMYTALKESTGILELGRVLIELRTDAPIDWNAIYAERVVARLTEEDGGSMDIADDIPIGREQLTADVKQKGEPVSTPVPEVDATVEETPDQSTALAVLPVAYELALEPKSADGAYKMAQYLYESRLYVRFPNKEAIFAVIVRGRELGLGALTALDSFHVIEGKPAPHAHLIVAMAEARPECEYFMLVSSDNTQCTYETKHAKNPGPTRHTYRIQDAVDAGLCGLDIIPRDTRPEKDGSLPKDRRGNWDKRRAEMLRKTCAVQLVRIVYPSAAMGLYAVFELGGDE